VSDLLDKAFGGSASQLVMQALAAKPASADELAQIRRLLDELEGGKQ
jgi:predicted transcriptional regulator